VGDFDERSKDLAPIRAPPEGIGFYT
jgi:hypothetical protein